MPLVVVLHGCTQDASVYDRGSGWSRLADRHGFALLFPEQQRSNNPNLCFNWFNGADNGRGKGEAASIRAMIDRMCALHNIDQRRIFVTGLSAGGAMASVMLATYPEVFAGGAIIAGLPYGCAEGMAQAFECMGGRGSANMDSLANSVRAASPHRGPWPRVSVWHGSEDRIVSPTNGRAIVGQWLKLHGLDTQPTRTEQVDGYPRQVWSAPTGEDLIEEYVVTGMAHGTPLMPGTGDGQSGEAMAHMLDVGLSSTDRIASFFGIALPSAAADAPPTRVEPPQARPRKRIHASAFPKPKLPKAKGVGKVIEDALRAAGLMR